MGNDHNKHITLRETNSKFAPENWWLEDDSFPFGALPIFRGKLAVSFRGCGTQQSFFTNHFVTKFPPQSLHKKNRLSSWWPMDLSHCQAESGHCLVPFLSYGWWKKSCTIVEMVDIKISHYLRGFIYPRSQVVQDVFHQQYHSPWRSMVGRLTMNISFWGGLFSGANS